MDLSIVIPVYQQLTCLDQTLRALSDQRLDRRHFEVIIVDDGSAEDVAGVVARYGDRLSTRLVRLPVNRGRAAARNRGCAEASGERIVFMDADSYALPDLLVRHHRFHRGWPDRILLGARREHHWRVPTAEPGDRGDTHGYGVDLRYRWGLDPARFATSPVPWLYGYTHNMSVPHAQFQACGGFDEHFTQWGHEDIELSYRMFLAAGRTPGHFQFDPAALCFHLPHFRTARQNRAEAGAGLRYLVDKHDSLDVEFLYEGPRTVSEVVPAYLERLAFLRRRRCGETVPEALAALPPPTTRRLVVGMGVRDHLPRDGLSVPLDHQPAGNRVPPPRVGVSLPFPDGHFADLVNMDVWRILSPGHLSELIVEGLRVATVLYLGFSRSLDGAGPAGVVDEPGRVRDLLRHHCHARIVRDTDRVCLIEVTPHRR